MFNSTLRKKMTGSYCYTIYDSFFGHFRRRRFHIEDAGSSTSASINVNWSLAD